MPDLLRTPLILAVALAAGALPAACDRPDEPAAQTAPARAQRTVATSFYPTTFFAQRIAGPLVTVVCPCPADEDPLAWMPSRDALAVYQGASLVLLNGAGYEAWTASAALPPSRVVDTTASLAADLLTYPAITHIHGPGGAHSHTGTDGHTWMDPRTAATQAAAIREALARAWPADAHAFDAGYDALRADLLKLDERLAALGGPAKAAALFASHPAYGYLARRYGWSVVNLDAPPDHELSPEQWAAVGEAVGKAPAGPRVMLFEQEPAPATRDRLLKEWSVTAVVFDPCEQPGEGAYLERMNRNVDRLGAALVTR